MAKMMIFDFVRPFLDATLCGSCTNEDVIFRICGEGDTRKLPTNFLGRDFCSVTGPPLGTAMELGSFALSWGVYF
jgi:hypothetical protein